MTIVSNLPKNMACITTNTVSCIIKCVFSLNLMAAIQKEYIFPKNFWMCLIFGKMSKKLKKNFCVKFYKILLKIFAPYEIALIEISYVIMQKIEPKIFKICLRKYFKIFWTFLNNLNKLEIFHKFQPKNFVENYVLFDHEPLFYFVLLDVYAIDHSNQWLWYKYDKSDSTWYKWWYKWWYKSIIRWVHP